MGPRSLVVAIVLLLGLVEARSAEACSCMGRRLSRVVVPEDGAADVPLDTQVRVFLTGFEPELRELVAGELRLRLAGGAIVKTTSQVVGPRIDLVPDQPLAPDTRYEIEALAAYDDGGQRMSDTERWYHASGLGQSTTAKVHVAWFGVAAFTTGRGTASTAAPTPVVKSTDLYRRQGGGDCGPANSLSLTLEPVDVPSLWTLDLEVRGQGVVTSLPPGHYDRIGAGNSLCAFDKVWVRPPGEARLVLRGPSGKAVTTPWQRPKGAFGSVPPRSPLGADVIARWRGATVVADPQPVTEPLVHCAMGLEPRSSTRIASAGAARSYEDISSLGLFGGKPTVVVSSSQDRPILQRLGEPALVLAQSGRGPRAWFDERGAIVATTDWPANGKEAQVVVARVNQRGAASWTRRLGIAGEVSDDPRIVAGEGAALVTWERRTPSYDEELCWVVVDDAKGSTRQKADVCIPEAEGYVGVGHVGETFLIAHHRRRGHARGEPELLLLGDGVAPKAVALPTGSVGGGMDLAVVADREVGLVAEKDGAIVWTKLGPDGRVLRGPKVLSRGRDNRKPRITWAHGVFVVAWEIFPGDRAVAVAVDRFGHVSSSLELFPGQDPSTVAVAPAKHGFWATAVSGYHAMVFGELACASQPSRLAPDRIAIP